MGVKQTLNGLLRPELLTPGPHVGSLTGYSPEGEALALVEYLGYLLYK